MYDHKICDSCKYSGKLNENQLCCLYILINNHSRGCYDGDVCTKYEKRNCKRRAQINLEGGFYYYEEQQEHP